MKKNALRLWLVSASLAGSFFVLAPTVHAQKLWISPTDGFWKDGTNWTGGTPPFSTNTVQISNASNKVVTIDAATPAANLTITRLNLWGTNTFTNTLVMDNVTTNNPLILTSPLTIGKGGAFRLINSAVQVPNSLTVSNGGSLSLTNASLLINAGAGMALNVYGGSVTLDSGLISVGDSNVAVRVGRSTSASLLINGGSMQVGSHMTLGESGFNNSQGNLKMTGGQLALSSFLSLGDGLGSTGIVSMTGGQLVVTNSDTNGFVRVGNLGNGQMLVSNATVTISSELSIADNSGSTGIVTLVSSQLTVATNSTNVMRIGNHGAGQMIVSNATLVFPDTSVGRHAGSVGIFTIQSDAIVLVTDDLSIGRFGDPVNSARGSLLMTGGQLVVTNDNTSIWVGREGIGQMTVSNGLVQVRGLLVAAVPTNTASGTLTLAGGTVLISSNFVVGDAGLSTGKVSIVGANVSVTNQSGSALMECSSGSVTFNSGTLATDNLRLTNTSGCFIFNGGTLISGNTTVSNSVPFVVGDGTNTANFQLAGGTHYFADGLTISSNATLSGCGTIIGTIINQGTIATNCGVVLVAPSITQQPSSLVVTQGATAIFTVAATGNPPPTYQWRFGGLPGNIPGATNSMLIIAGAQATNAGNYRVLASNSSGTATSVIATLRVLIPTAITNTSLVGTNFNFSFGTVSGLSYTVEYKTNLTDASWLPLRNIPGNGAIFSFQDLVTPAIPRRFYRIHVQ